MQLRIEYHYIIVVFIFIALGVVIRAGTNNIESFNIRFDDKCGDSQTCEFPFFVKKKIEGPIYVYLHFKDFYIQHRKSLKSLDQDQLAGEYQSVSDVKNTCSGMVTNEDFAQDYSVTGAKLNPQSTLSPCGIYASLFPQDRFNMDRKNSNDTYSSIPISNTNIAWQSLKENKYKMIDGGKEQWTNVTNGSSMIDCREVY